MRACAAAGSMGVAIKRQLMLMIMNITYENSYS